MKSLLRRCDVCDGARGEVLHAPRFVLPDEDPLPRGYDVVACERCGFVFADTPAAQDVYDAYYALRSKYESATVGTGGGSSTEDRARLADVASLLAASAPWRDRRVCDLGCANGGLLGALREAGFTRVDGVDPSAGCAATTRSLGFAARQGGLCAGAVDADDPVHLLCVSHVLEHVRDLRGAVASLRARIAADGLLYAEVPDAAAYADHLRAPFQEFNTEHVDHFTEATLTSLLARGGFVRVASGRKVFDGGGGVPVPAAWVLARRGDVDAEPAAPAHDGDGVTRVRSYVARSAAMLAHLDAQLAPHVGAPMQVWGTGQLLFKLLAETCLARATIVAFLDGNAKLHGSTLRGVSVHAPAEAVPGVPILAASTLHGRAIEAAARRLGLRNDVIVLA